MGLKTEASKSGQRGAHVQMAQDGDSKKEATGNTGTPGEEPACGSVPVAPATELKDHSLRTRWGRRGFGKGHHSLDQ